MKTGRTKKRTGEAAFTLIELLTAITILSIMLLALSSAMGLVSRLWINGIGTIDNFSKARVILNLLDRDVQMMVMRADTAAFADNNNPPNPACAFYTNVQGTPGAGGRDSRAVSLVQYILNPSAGSSDAAATTLGRLNYGMNYFSPTSGNQITTQLGTAYLSQLTTAQTVGNETLASGVIEFQFQFADGTGAIITPTLTTPYSYNYSNRSASSNPRTVIISLLVLSNSAYIVAEQTGKVSAIQSIFNGSVGTNQTYSQYWNNTLQNPPTSLTSLPGSVQQGLQVFERHIPLPVTASSF